MLFLFLFRPIYGQNEVPKEAKIVAQKTLKTYLNNFVTKKNYGNFGFKKYEDVQSARLDTGLPERFIRLKDLQIFDPQENVKSVMRDTRTWWFPVYAGPYLATKIEVIRKEERWIGGEFGGIRAVNIIEKNRHQLSELIENGEVNRPTKIFLIKIPSLASDFLFIENEDGSFLMPAMIQAERLDLENGKIYSADKLLLQLKPYAQKINPEKVY